MRKALEPMRDLARAKAPRDSDELAESIEIGNRVRGQKRTQKSDLEVYVGPRGGKGGIAYGGQQEFGNVNHAAKPFMRPAWDATKLEVLVIFGREMWSNLEKSLARHHRKVAREAEKLKAGK